MSEELSEDLPEDLPNDQDETAASSEVEYSPSRLEALERAYRRLTSDEPGFAVGDRLGPFVIEAEIGAGGFGVVYRARQVEGVDRQVAVKVLRAGALSADALTRFSIESRALALLQHSSIVRLLEASVSRPPYYLVMEYVDGEPLDAWIRRVQPDLRTRLDLFCRVCDGVHHAHQKGVLHRDLKPSNVLVTEEDGRWLPKVIDFGIAKALDVPLTAETFATLPDRVVGTPLFMSPERMRDAELGGTTAPDTRSDVYSLGLLLHLLLTGVLPFDVPPGLGGLALFLAVRENLESRDPMAPSVRARENDAAPFPPRELARDLDWITLASLRREPEDRYDSVVALAADVRRYLAGDPVTAAPPSMVYRARKFLRKRRGTLAIIGVALLALTALRLDLVRRETQRFRSHVEALAASWERDRDALAAELERLARARGAFDEEGTSWTPVWQRGAELSRWRRAGELGRLVGGYSADPAGLLEGAVTDPAIADAVGTFFRRLLEARAHLAGDGWRLALHEPRPGRVVLGVPPGSGTLVRLFRHVESEGRWVPLPFDAARGEVVAEPFVAVASVSASSALRAGDRIERVARREVRTFGELASALEGIEAGERVIVDTRRGAVEWVPFEVARDVDLVRRLARRGVERTSLAGELIDPWEQSGVVLDAYSLDIDSAPVVPEGEIALPGGSYLAVACREGQVVARRPFLVDAAPGAPPHPIEISLPTREPPPGYVFVSAGELRTGDDPGAFQSYGAAVVHVEAFCLARREVTFHEWQSLLADSGIAALVDAEGYGSPRSPVVAALLERTGRPPRVAWVPRRSAGPLFRRDERGVWRLDEEVCREEWPVFGVSHLAALEYAHWKGERDPEWDYRLPTGEEWEWAARGADRRAYVWGDYRVWSFCRSLRGNFDRTPRPGGTHPFDVSVFGVQDLGGSVAEHTIDRPAAPGTTLVTYRGGSWNTLDDAYFRLASRNGTAADASNVTFGLRLVAVP